MKKATVFALGAALLIGMSGAALAQQGSNGSATGSTTNNSTKSGGPGTHVGAQRTGSQSNTQKVFKNQNGYQGH